MFAFHEEVEDKTRRSAAGSAQRSGRWGRGFDPRRLDQKYGETLRLHRIFCLRWQLRETTYYRGFARETSACEATMKRENLSAFRRFGGSRQNIFAPAKKKKRHLCVLHKCLFIKRYPTFSL